MVLCYVLCHLWGISDRDYNWYFLVQFCMWCVSVRCNPSKQRVHWARQDYSHSIHTLAQADGKTDDPRSSHSGPSIFISWLLAHRLPMPITSPWVRWQLEGCWHTHTLCLENKVGMKKKVREKENSDSNHKRKQWKPKMVHADGLPSKPLNNFTFIKTVASLCAVVSYCSWIKIMSMLVDMIYPAS